MWNRETRSSYLNFVKNTTPGYTASKFHTYLCNQIDEFLNKKTTNAFDILLLSVPPQHGKLASNDTPVLTTSGFKNHGDLVVGDYVYGLDGEPKRVTHIFPKQLADKIIRFSNGEEIKVHGNHEWVLHDRKKHGAPIVQIETKNIEVHANNIVGRGHRYRYLLPERVGLQTEHNKLLVDPYTLGLWLGDGQTTASRITMSNADGSVIIPTLPYTCTSSQTGDNVSHYYLSDGLISQLKELGVASKKYGERTKHIPDDYLISSHEQRLELLAGLIDSDGYVYPKNGRTVITTSDEMLRDSIISLISTFGWRTTVTTEKPKKSSRGIQGREDYYVVGFQPEEEIPCRLDRKRIFVKAKKRKISVVSIEDIEPVEGNCIEVEGGIYLIGKTMIPTHNSITVTKRVAAYQMMRRKNTRVIIGSYNEDFSIEFGRANRETIREYGEQLFGVKLRERPDRNVEFETDNGGRCISRGIMSGITGNPADLFIIDDPIKNRQEADSKTTRNALINEYLNSVRTRIAPGGKVIIIQTRWHEDDLYGWIQRNESNVTSINMPCEWDEDVVDVLGRVRGDALCPEIGRGNLWLEDFKKAYTGKQGTRAWTALYQGKPNLLEGNIIKQEWWQYYNTLPDNIPYVIMSVDCAFKSNEDSDYVAIQVWGKKDDNIYLLDALKQHLSFVETLEAIREKRRQYPDTIFILIEDKANGTAVINVLSSEMEGVIPIEPAGGKESRVHAVTPVIERGNVYLPRYSAFVGDFVAECSAFPNSDNDDQVDAMSQALNRMIYVDAKYMPPAKVVYRKWTEDMMEDYERADEALQIDLITMWGYPEEWR